MVCKLTIWMCWLLTTYLECHSSPIACPMDLSCTVWRWICYVRTVILAPRWSIYQWHIMWTTLAIQGVLRNHYCRMLFAVTLWHAIWLFSINKIYCTRINKNSSRIYLLFYKPFLHLLPVFHHVISTRELANSTLIRRWGNSSPYPPVRRWC